MKINNIFSSALLYGLSLGLLFNLIFHLYLTGDKAYLGDDAVSYATFCLLGITCLVMFRHYTRKYTNNIPDLPHLMVLAYTLSLVIAICMGLGHFINASFIDPAWGENSLALLHPKWLAHNYSEADIAGQIEWTDTFQNPIKWAMVLVIFFTIVYSIIGNFVALLFYFVSRHFFKKPLVSNFRT